MEHEFFCPAFQGPLAILNGEPPSGECCCGPNVAKLTATATQEPPTPVVADVKPAAAPEAPAQESSPESQTPDGAKKSRKPRAKKTDATPENPVSPEVVAESPVDSTSSSPVGAQAPVAETVVTQPSVAETPVVISVPPETSVVSTPADACGRCWGTIEFGVMGAYCTACAPEVEREERETRNKKAAESKAEPEPQSSLIEDMGKKVMTEVTAKVVVDVVATLQPEPTKAQASKAEAPETSELPKVAAEAYVQTAVDSVVVKPLTDVPVAEPATTVDVCFRLRPPERKRRSVVEKSLAIKNEENWQEVAKKTLAAKHGPGSYEGEFLGDKAHLPKWVFDVNVDEAKGLGWQPSQTPEAPVTITGGAGGTTSATERSSASVTIPDTTPAGATSELAAFKAGDTIKEAAPVKLTDGDKVAVLDVIAKSICVGCREGLLLEREGMEPVVATGLPGQPAWVSLSDPKAHDLPGEKWHLACLQQKQRLETEGRIKINAKDGTYEILSPTAAKVAQLERRLAAEKVDLDKPLSASANKIVNEITEVRASGTPAPAPSAGNSDGGAATVVITVDATVYDKPLPAESASRPKRRLFVGVDPDIKGYLAIYSDAGEVVELTPIPTTGGEKPVYDEHGMVRVAKRWKDLGVEMVLLERQQALGRFMRDGKEVNMGSIANFRKGVSYGLWRGILAALEIRFDTIAPITWKKGIGIAGGDPKQVKGRAVTKAQSLHPNIDLRPIERKPKARVPDPSKAESILLSRFVMLRETGGFTAANEGKKPVEEPEDEEADEGETVDGADEENPPIAEISSEPSPVPSEQAVATPATPESPSEQVAAQSQAAPAPVEQAAQVEPMQAAPVAGEAPKATISTDEQTWLHNMTVRMTNGEFKGPGVTGAKLKKAAAQKAAPEKRTTRKTPTAPKAAKKADGPKKPLTAAEKAMRRVLGLR